MNEDDIHQISLSKDNMLMAVGDKLGKLKIYCYPAHLDRQKCLSVDGHQSNVKCVEFI